MQGLVDLSLSSAIDSVPAGAWAVGVSGGADSVALLSLLRRRADLLLTIAHLDHETRAGASALDAAFVRQLCDAWGIPCVLATLSTIEHQLPPPRLRNLSARYRFARLALFRQVVGARGLLGVILAHHADDQAETVLHRLLRGAPPSGLTGMANRTTVGDVTILRPLLGVPKQMLREHLHVVGQPWREDESNDSPQYTRNRIRRLLAARPALVEPLIDLGEQCRELNDWVDLHAPSLEPRFRVSAIRAMPLLLARRALQRWLRERCGDGAGSGGGGAGGGVGFDDIGAAATERLFEMALDAASAPRQHFPGGILVCRRGGEIFASDDH